MEYMKKEEINFYHGLGGVSNIVNDIESMGHGIAGYDKNQMDSISLYRLKKILEQGNIYCGNLIDDYTDCYFINFDKDMVYLAADQDFGNEDYYKKENYLDWVGASLSLLIDLEKATKLGGVRMHANKSSCVEGEINVEKSIPAKYIKALCMPVVAKFLYDQWNRKNPLTLKQYLIERNKEFKIIQSYLKEFDYQIPVIETATFSYITDCFEFEEMIESLGKNDYSCGKSYKKVYDDLANR